MRSYLGAAAPRRINFKQYMAMKVRVANAKYSRILAAKGVTLGTIPKKPLTFLMQKFKPMEGRIIKVNAKAYTLANPFARSVVSTLPRPFNAWTRRLNAVAAFFTFVRLDPIALARAMGAVLPDFKGKADDLLNILKGKVAAGAGAVVGTSKQVAYDAAMAKYRTDQALYSASVDARSRAKVGVDSRFPSAPRAGSYLGGENNPAYKTAKALWDHRYDLLPRELPKPVEPRKQDFGLSGYGVYGPDAHLSGYGVYGPDAHLSGYGVYGPDAHLSGYGVYGPDAHLNGYVLGARLDGFDAFGSTTEEGSWNTDAGSTGMDETVATDSAGIDPATDTDSLDPAANNMEFSDEEAEAGLASGEGSDSQNPPAESGSDEDVKGAAKAGAGILMTIPQLLALIKGLGKSVSTLKGAGQLGGGSPAAAPPPAGQPGAQAMQGQSQSLSAPVSTSAFGGAAGAMVALAAVVGGLLYVKSKKKG